jgi:hypothetical protein
MLAAALVLAFTAAASPPPARPIAVAGGGFEERGGPGALPVGWTVEASPNARVETTAEARAEGSRALAIRAPAEGAEVTVRSGPVALEVGHLYRLSAWVRTRGVKPDPQARYPTALGACVAMRSFPFTNCSAPARSDGEGRLEVLFFATGKDDAVALHLGRNGRATGTAIFDDVRLEKVEDVTAYVPLERVRWAGKGFRYDDGGWKFVHVEGAPYERGHQYGELVAAELATFLEKLAVLENKADPARGWKALRLLANALTLRRFDPEYLEEMKGIADGANAGGARFQGKPLDLLDVVTMNSTVDLGQLEDAAGVTPTPISGRTFLRAEDEAAEAGKGDHCSSFVATKSATKDGRFVFGQLFMWNGYTGVHWDVMLDVVPDQGHRHVFQTFPGGMHSGSDFYLNAAGLVIGETTVAQTPFDPDGTPQSNRSRKAAQYASSIDEAARILRERNNGLYTNDWTMADAKTDEGACLLLGTKASKLWRTGSKGKRADTPAGLRDFIWANNNARDPAVRRETAVTADDAPVDVAFPAWNRDVAFLEWYRAHGAGEIDLEKAIRLWASSPVNRPHACDGKLTTGEMAEQLVFLAHYGKTTLREKWVGGRWIENLPNAIPHLTLGYTTFSPIFVADRLKAARAERAAAPERPSTPGACAPYARDDRTLGTAGDRTESKDAKDAKPDLAAFPDLARFDAKLLWKGTVYPAAEADRWFTSGSAAYHAMLKKLPDDAGKAHEALRDGLADLDLREAWLAGREEVAPPARAAHAWDRYGGYQIPRIRGTFALHQLRLALGNATFSKAMRAVHARYAGKPVSTAEVLRALSAAAGRDVAPILKPFLERTELPDPEVAAAVAEVKGEGGASAFEVTLTVKQPNAVWPFVAAVEVRTAKGSRLERVEVKDGDEAFTLRAAEPPTAVVFNAAADLPVRRDDPYVLGNLLDDFSNLLYVWGSAREVEAGRSLGLLWRDVVADAFVEILPPLVADAEATDAELAAKDLVLLGGAADNLVVARLAREGKLPVELGNGFFRFRGTTYARPDDGIALAFPNPWNPKRAVYLYAANSRLQLWHMVKGYPRGQPGFALWRGGEVVRKGHLGAERYELPLAAPAARVADAPTLRAAGPQGKDG